MDKKRAELQRVLNFEKFCWTNHLLRDIHDKLGIPVLLVGMELADKKLQKYGHINDRIFAKLKFEKLSKEDFKEIIETLSDVEFSDNAIKHITNRNLQFRQIIKVITKAEQLANTNKLSEIVRLLILIRKTFLKIVSQNNN